MKRTGEPLLDVSRAAGRAGNGQRKTKETTTKIKRNAALFHSLHHFLSVSSSFGRCLLAPCNASLADAASPYLQKFGDLISQLASAQLCSQWCVCFERGKIGGRSPKGIGAGTSVLSAHSFIPPLPPFTIPAFPSSSPWLAGWLLAGCNPVLPQFFQIFNSNRNVPSLWPPLVFSPPPTLCVCLLVGHTSQDLNKGGPAGIPTLPSLPALAPFSRFPPSLQSHTSIHSTPHVPMHKGGLTTRRPFFCCLKCLSPTNQFRAPLAAGPAASSGAVPPIESAVHPTDPPKAN